jgi:predicted NBD/HSP70 family sugar kinase
MQATGDLQLVKRINRSALLRQLRAAPGLSRAALAKQSGLTKSTVTVLVRELLDEHWLSEAAETVAAPGLGRPSTPLHINARARVLIGIEIAVECLRLVCISLGGTVVHASQAPLQSKHPPDVCNQATAMVLELLRELSRGGHMLCGIGVCLPGAINEESGLVRLAPNLQWRDLPFLELFAAAFARAGLPPTTIHLQNDADAAALGEYEFGDSAGAPQGPLIFINCDVGVGAGIVLNDRLFTGSSGLAGEIGHTILHVGGPRCSCGRHGCAETFIGSRALRDDAAVEQAGVCLGVLVQNLDAMFNPHTIILGGRSCVDHPEIIDTARRTMHSYASAAGMPQPVLRAARHGLQAAAVGAAALVLHRFLRPLSAGASFSTTTIR